MDFVRAKKHLGQHFLKDQRIAERIASSVLSYGIFVLEIGPGMGILTRPLLERHDTNLSVVEIDRDSVTWLETNLPSIKGRIYSEDFLKMDLSQRFPSPMAITGNFPYNISSQILFKALENRDQVVELTGMFQKEVAERIASVHGNKTYGILSVLVQLFYSCEYLFTVNENEFNPPPKVKSGVIRLLRRTDYNPDCDETFLFTVVKTAFNQRRKTLRNALSGLVGAYDTTLLSPWLQKRAEQLSPIEFVEMTKTISDILLNNRIKQ